MTMAKYIFVTGGVVSSLGKGVTASSLGRLLKNRGLKVFMQKFDPYLNFDPSLMDPCEHGEVFVTDDGAETDLDLGHYERFIDERLSQNSSITTGRVYSNVIKCEREGGYGRATVQVIPHITTQIKTKLIDAAVDSDADIILIPYGEENQSEEGKLATIKYARENNIPLFGIGQGIQMITAEYAKNKAKILADNIIQKLPDEAINKDEEWRTGLFEIRLTADSKIASIYEKN